MNALCHKEKQSSTRKRKQFMPVCPLCKRSSKVVSLEEGVSSEVNGVLQEADKFCCNRCNYVFHW